MPLATYVAYVAARKPTKLTINRLPKVSNVTNELSYLNEEPTRHIRSLENPEEHAHPLLTRRDN